MKELYCEKSYRGEKLCSVCFYKDVTKQELHREDGPAKIEYYYNENIERVEYYKDGVLHREDGPAKIEYWKNGNKRLEVYYIDGKRYREDGPVQTSYYEMWNDHKHGEIYLIRDSKGEIIDDITIAYYSNGGVECELHFKGDHHHRENGPAITHYYENGNKKYDEYLIEGKLHREDGPARIWYREDGSKDYEEYFKIGVRHRIDGPTVTQYYENGNKIYEVYYINGRRHRKNGPARVQYYKNGNIEYVTYFKHGLYHREDGPASTQYYKNGNKKCDKYYIEGKPHREDGPAVIWYDEYGVEHRKIYYINGEQQDAEYIKNNIEKNKQNIICDKSYDRNINDFIGRTVRHFKGNEYLVLCTALNTESDEIMVIYKALYGENITYARPLKMFMEEVPANKENPTGQKYRFQLAYL